MYIFPLTQHYVGIKVGIEALFDYNNERNRKKLIVRGKGSNMLSRGLQSCQIFIERFVYIAIGTEIKFHSNIHTEAHTI